MWLKQILNTGKLDADSIKAINQANNRRVASPLKKKTLDLLIHGQFELLQPLLDIGQDA